MTSPEVQTWQRCFGPKDRREIWEWAKDNVVLPQNGVFTKTGPFDVSESRHFIAPMEWLWSPYVREVNVLKPVRSGGTLIADVWLPSCIIREPGPFLSVFQENEIAREHCELRTWPILESMASIRAMLELLDKDSARTQEIIFPHMPVIYTGPSINKLQSKGFRYLVADEPWLYQKGKLAEAKGRLGDFAKMGIAKFLGISQGGYAKDLGDKQNADWFNQHASGEDNAWHVQCLSCGKYQFPKWNGRRSDKSRWGIVWDEHRDERGNWILSKAVPSVRWVCFHCGHIHIDGSRTKSEWNRTGRYEVHGEQSERKKSCRWPGVIDTPWADMLEEALLARNVAHQGDKTLWVKFIQKKLAEHYDPQGYDDDYEQLPTVEITLSDEKPIEAEGITFIHRFGLVDVQHDHFWFLFDAWSDKGDDITLHFEKLYSWDEVEARREQFNIPHENLCVDVSHRRHEVITECARHGRESGGRWVCWKAFQGSDRAGFMWIPKSGKQAGQRIELPYSWPPGVGDPCSGLRVNDPRRSELKGKLCQVVQWSNPTIKDVAARRRDSLATGTRSLVGEGDWVEEFSRQMYSEKKVVVVDKLGKQKVAWQRFRDNHGWDCKGMSITRAFMLHLIGAGKVDE